MNPVAIIPARKGSKRLPNKNFLPINGIRLVDRAVNVAKEAGIFDEIIVTTDDQFYSPADATIFLRHRFLCDDNVQTAAVVFDLLSQLKFSHDEFCVLNPSTPTRDADDVKYAYYLWKQRARYLWSLASGDPSIHDGAFLFVNTLEFIRRMKIIDDETKWYSLENQVDINTQEDFDRAEQLLIAREGDHRAVE